ncbi:MAG: hypothetical protein KatS3mg077_1545 [Candidatus Binatia bacterium]|nr:MAG: hypothetical protein KatS3mg077_1535 [Candidatus Binatia bacterium]GIW44263.1 MAG: hypothetical protein KatS3mg077_1545 [Candidatus Binatia bacterium]
MRGKVRRVWKVSCVFSLFIVGRALSAAAAPCFPVPQFLGVIAELAPNSVFKRDWLEHTSLAWFYGKRYKLDPRLAFAIAGQETRFATDPNAAVCLRGFNAWGIMDCTSSGCRCRQFYSWRQAWETVSRLLGVCYVQARCKSSDFPRDTIPLIAAKYCPPGVDPRCANWPNGVRTFCQRFGGIAFPNGRNDWLTWFGGCCIDCNGDGYPTISDALVAVNALLGGGEATQFCLSLDYKLEPGFGLPDGFITVDELLVGVTEILNGCPAGE